MTARAALCAIAHFAARIRIPHAVGRLNSLLAANGAGTMRGRHPTARFATAVLLAVLPPIPASGLTTSEVRAALAERRYEYLRNTLTGYRSAYESGSIDETVHAKLLRGFWDLGQLQDDSLDFVIDGWVASQHDSSDTLIARGIYRQSRGWEARGVEFAHKTPRENFHRMGKYFAGARADFIAAQRTLGRCDLCWARRINMSRADGREAPGKLLEKALADNPRAHEAVLAYSTALEPRWGGAPGQLEKFVQDFCGTNPSATACPPLQARLLLDQQRALVVRKDYRAAENAVDRALALDPESREAWEQKAWLLAGRGEDVTAVRLLDASIGLGHRTAWAYSQRAHLHYRAGRIPEAMRDYEAAAELGDADALSQALGMMLRGAYGAARDPVRAVALCERMADRRLAAGALCLGELHYSGGPVVRDVAKAAGWYALAAEQGNAKAMTALGILKWNGQGVPRDRRVATRLWRQARDADETIAMERLAALGPIDTIWYVKLPDFGQSIADRLSFIMALVSALFRDEAWQKD